MTVAVQINNFFVPQAWLSQDVLSLQASSKWGPRVLLLWPYSLSPVTAVLFIFIEVEKTSVQTIFLRNHTMNRYKYLKLLSHTLPYYERV